MTNDQKLAAAGKPLFDSGARLTGRLASLRCSGNLHVRIVDYGRREVRRFGGRPAIVTPASGRTTTTFKAVWASGSLSGYVFDVEVRYQKAGSKQWSAWTAMATGTTAPLGTATPTSGAGTYAIHARLRNAATGKASGWSPDVLVTVAP